MPNEKEVFITTFVANFMSACSVALLSVGKHNAEFTPYDAQMAMDRAEEAWEVYAEAVAKQLKAKRERIAQEEREFYEKHRG